MRPLPFWAKSSVTLGIRGWECARPTSSSGAFCQGEPGNRCVDHTVSAFSEGRLIAEYLGATVDEVLEAMESSSAYSSVPLEAPAGGADSRGDAPSVLDRYATEDSELDFTDDRLILEEEACVTLLP